MFQVFLFRSRQHIGLNAHELDMTQICGCKPFNDKKYRDIRRGLQKQGKYKKVKQIKNRESRIVRNLNHHISKKIVEIATKTESCIKLETVKYQTE